MDNIELAELDNLLEMLKENFSTMQESNESMIRGMEGLIERKTFDDDKVIYLHEQIKVRRSLQEKIDQGIDKLKDISVLRADEVTELMENCLDVYQQNFLIHKRMSEIMSLILGDLV
jgi:anthranilate phosphoribosyltransferase